MSKTIKNNQKENDQRKYGPKERKTKMEPYHKEKDRKVKS